jgi:serine-type D-Ala-D-Ala carboxypeptidase/endopeptidase (penicillin-binding protein 4)
MNVVVGLSCFLSLLAESAMAQSVCQADIAPQIEAITNRPAFRRARWGILIQTLSTAPETVYSHDADKFFIPASNVKLLTTAAALTQLGPDFRLRTLIYQIPTPSLSQKQEVILRIVGQGDPSFSDEQLQSLVGQIHQQGIRHVDQLLADAQYFQNDAIHPHWEWEDVQAGYGAPVNSLILNQNAIGLTLVPQAMGQPLRVQWDDPNETSRWQVVNRSRTVATTALEYVQVGRDLSQPILYVDGQLRVGSASEPVAVSVPQPTQHFLDRLQDVLATEQIRVEQTAIVNDPLPAAAQPIASVDSPPLAELLIETNQQSNNLYAEALLRTLGRQQRTNLDDHKSALGAGIETLQAILTRLGIASNSYSLADGSGLSRQNLVSPAALVATLQAMAQSPDAAIYRASLPVAGISGTLHSRFLDTPVQNRLQAKTGALSGIAALSGYLQPMHSPQLVLSILINHVELSSGEIQAAMDAIVQLVAKLEPC